MKPEGCEADLLRALSRMPFLDRLEMVAVCGWSRGAVYEAVEKLESGGFCASVPHGTGLLPSSRRFHLTESGLRRLAGEEGMALDELVRSRPVSAQWRRSLMERLDAVASVYGVASTVSSLAFPIRFRWYRSIPLDAAMTLPDGRTVGIVRQGLTADRSGFSRRLWGLRDWPMPGTVLVLMADEVRLRHARRLLSTTDVPALFAVERLAVLTGAGDRIWSPPKVGAEIDLRYALDRVGPGGQLPIEPEPQRADPPADFAVEGPGWDIPDHMLPVLLKPIEKRALDLISDWPWIALKELAGLMGVSTQRVSHGVIPLEGFGLAARPRGAGGRLALTDRGLALLARRDRTSVAVAKQAVERRPGGRRRPVRVAQRHRQEGPPTAQEHRAHRRRPRLPRRARRAGPPAGVGGRPARPAPQGIPPPPARRQDARRQPRRLRRTSEGRHALALLPGVGAPRRAALDHVRPARPLSALLLFSQTHRRPRHEALSPGRLRRRDRPDPLPARGAGGDPRIESQRAPAGVPQGGRRRPGADGTRLAHPRRPGDPPGPAAPMNDEGRRPMPKQDTHKQEGPRRRRGRIVVRLDTAAVWKRLALLNRSQNWLAREIGVSPGYVSMLVNKGRSPSGRIRRRMLKALEVTEFQDLFRLEERDEQD